MISAEHTHKAQLAILKAQFNFAMDERDWSHAQQYLERFHELAQNRSMTHIESHCLFAKLYFQNKKWRSTAVHLYLAIMAPYGTFRRRRGVA
ncbi:MAG: DUF3703 domain-containing protein [Myxococcota bacterium]